MKPSGSEVAARPIVNGTVSSESCRDARNQEKPVRTSRTPKRFEGRRAIAIIPLPTNDHTSSALTMACASRACAMSDSRVRTSTATPASRPATPIASNVRLTGAIEARRPGGRRTLPPWG